MIEGQNGVAWREWVAIADACERHGIAGLFRSDHLSNLAPGAELGSLEAWTTLAGLAAVTSTLRLGTLVSPATFRHPSLLAKMVTTVDHISDGRAELGIGAGWHVREHEAHGIPFPDDLRERRERLEEQLQVLHGHWSGKTATYAGRHHHLDALRALPAPVQHPRPPIILGGWGGPRSLALGARWADEYNLPYVPPARLAEHGDALAQACDREGRDPIPISTLAGVILADTPTELLSKAEVVAARIGRGETGAQMLERVAGSWVVGSREEALERLKALQAAGARRVYLQHFLHEDLEALHTIGRVLSPALRAPSATEVPG